MTQTFRWTFEDVLLGSSLPTLLPASTGTVKYVATTGNDTTGDGSVGNPWKSLQKLLDTLTAGQVGEMAAGVYNAPVGSPNGRHTLAARSGTSTDPIEVRAAAGATVQIRPTAASPHEVLVITEGAAYWRFRNLIFELAGTGSNYQNVYVADNVAGCTDIEFWNCEIRLAREGTGYFVEEGCTRVYLINSSVHDNYDTVSEGTQRQGAYITGDDCMAINSLFYNHYGYGIQVRTNDADGPDSVIVANNVAYNNKPFSGSAEFAGIMCESKADDCQVWNNISYDNRNGFRGVSAASIPTTANICRKNIANANDNTQYANNHGTNWALDFDGAGDHTGPGDNLTSDPLLTDPANDDFHLQAGSPAIGYGNPAFCPAFDHDNAARSQCDAGAYRYA